MKKILTVVAFVLLSWVVVSYLIGCNINPGMTPNPKYTECKCVGKVISPKRTGSYIMDAEEVERCLGFIIWRETYSPLD